MGMRVSKEIEERIMATPGVIVSASAKIPDAQPVQKERVSLGDQAPSLGDLRPSLEGSRARGRHVPGRMNKTEAAYAAHLEQRRLAGDILGYWFEPWKFRLADRTYYSFDFAVMLKSMEIEIHEVKGFWEDDARAKWKVAAELFSFFAFVAVQRVKKQWKEERYR